MRKAIEHLKNADPVLGSIIERVGPYGIKFLEPDFETLVKSIVSQQLSGKVAKTIYGRVIEAAGGRLTPESLLKLRPTRMRTLGLSRQKAGYLRDLSQRARDGLRLRRLGRLKDETLVETLTVVKGVGRWTVEMLLIFRFGRPDVLPVADYGIQKAMQRAYGMRKLPKPDRMRKIAEAWRPYRSIACWYLWRSLDVKTP